MNIPADAPKGFGNVGYEWVDRSRIDEIEARIVGEQVGFAGPLAARFALEYLRICADLLADYYRLPG